METSEATAAAMTTRLLDPRRSGRALLYLAGALLTSILAFAVWLAGGIISLVLAITLLGIFATIGTAWAFRQVADLDRRLAGWFREEPIRGTYRQPASGGWFDRLRAVLTDPQTWKDLLWLVIHSILGFAIAVAALSAAASVLGMILMPAWWWALPEDEPYSYGIFEVTSLGWALLTTVIGLLLAPLVLLIVRWLARAHAGLAARLLGPSEAQERRATEDERAAAVEPASARASQVEAAVARLGRADTGPGRRDQARLVALAMHAGISAVLGVLATVLWAATGGAFWPAWVWFGLGVALAVHAGLRWALTFPAGAQRAVAIQGAISAVAAGALVLIWALTGGGSFWPLLPTAILGAAVAVSAIVIYRDRLWPREREQALARRVGELTRTREGALQAQAAELQRIERDLHDGAQARIVALAMDLGMAEDEIAENPEAARELVLRAREDALVALADLRDLARGIRPALLTERGLPTALEALVERSPLPATLEVTGSIEAVPEAVESATYFVVAEALTNAAKHSGAPAVRVTIDARPGLLEVTVSDNGRGGADPEGSGLDGLRKRVAAVDGRFEVRSPAGGPTIVRVELPCE
jgi:signal transduction histidine kinase